MNSTTQTRSKGRAAMAVFSLALLGGTWIMGETPKSILPERASDFLSVLNTEELAGERLGIWDRLAAGFTLATTPAPHSTPRSL